MLREVAPKEIEVTFRYRRASLVACAEAVVALRHVSSFAVGPQGYCVVRLLVPVPQGHQLSDAYQAASDRAIAAFAPLSYSILGDEIVTPGTPQVRLIQRGT